MRKPIKIRSKVALHLTSDRAGNPPIVDSVAVSYEKLRPAGRAIIRNVVGQLEDTQPPIPTFADGGHLRRDRMAQIYSEMARQNRLEHPKHCSDVIPLHCVGPRHRVCSSCRLPDEVLCPVQRYDNAPRCSSAHVGPRVCRPQIH
jgi:hypothetical protein